MHFRYANACNVCKCMQMHKTKKFFIIKKIDIVFFYDIIRIVQGKEKSQNTGENVFRIPSLNELLTSCLHKFRPPFFGEKRWILK